MQNLGITLIQSDIYWHDKSLNLEMFEEKLDKIKESTDVIVLPEMFNTGFTMDTSLSEAMEGNTFNWIAKTANKYNAVVTGSFMVTDKEKIYNRLIWMQPNGKFTKYDKRHLFRMADEHNHFSFGKQRTIVSWKGWNIMLQVCYDLRFPVWARNRNLEYDAILFTANWPAARVKAWDTLLKARAIENLSYSIGLNRIGLDGNEISYNGHSAIYDPKGETVAFTDKEDIITTSLDYNALKTYRASFPAYSDSDAFSIRY